MPSVSRLPVSYTSCFANLLRFFYVLDFGWGQGCFAFGVTLHRMVSKATVRVLLAAFPPRQGGVGLPILH